jgi:protocatechuate 3,4-dioxygenase beta subunit
MTRREMIGALAVAVTARASELGTGPCATATSTTTIAGESEPGERMVVSGQVFLPDGVTPAAGIIMYAYHTDVRGYYNDRQGLDPRLRGWMRTDAQGRYEYRTIRPGVYPQRNVPAHVHYHFWGPGVPVQWSEELNFADDPLIKPEDLGRSEALGRFAFVKQGVITNGILHVTQDFRLKAKGDPIQANNRQGEDACHVGKPAEP